MASERVQRYLEEWRRQKEAQAPPQQAQQQPAPRHPRGDACEGPLPGEKDRPVPVLIRLLDVEVRPIEWLFEPWIPLGALTVLDGDPGLGKSTLLVDLAARVSRGWSMPPAGGPAVGPAGGPAVGPAGVILLTAEDDLSRTVRPRVEAAGGDAARVWAFGAVQLGGDERPPVLPWDLHLLEELVLRQEVRLLVVDPFSAFIGTEFDAHKDQDIRRCLHQMNRLAEKLGMGIVLIRHLNKLMGGPALYRGGGSIGITGAARSALVLGRDPADEHIRILAPLKNNLAPLPKALAYRLEPCGSVARCAWLGEVDLTPAEVLWHHQAAPGRPSVQSDRARKWMADLLAGGPVRADEVFERACQQDLAPKTIKRVKEALGVVSRKLNGTWYWILETPEIQGGHNSPVPP